MQRNNSLKLYLAILATGLMAFCGVLIETAMNVTFPTLMEQFQVDTATIQWLTTAYLLIVAIFVPIASFLKKNFTTKRLFLTANLLFISGLLICTFTVDFKFLLIGRIIQGASTGIALPLMFNIILEQAPLNKIGFLMGIGTLVTAIAPALGPTYGGLLAEIDWHLIFALLVIVLIISLVLGLYAIQQVTPTEKKSLDSLAWLFISIFFASSILAFNYLERSIFYFILFALIGLIALGSFIKRTKRSQTKLIDLHIFSNSAFNLHLLSFFIFQMINVGFAYILPNYLQLVTHHTSLIAGLTLLPGATLGALLAPISGRLYDKFGAKKPIFIGIFLQMIGVVVLWSKALNASSSLILSGYIFVMLGTGFALGNVMTNGLAQLSETLKTDGNTAFNTLQQFGGALGTAVVSLLLAAAQTKTNYSYTTAIGARHVFIFLFILVMFNALAMMISFKKID